MIFEKDGSILNLRSFTYLKGSVVIVDARVGSVQFDLILFDSFFNCLIRFDCISTYKVQV